MPTENENLDSPPGSPLPPEPEPPLPEPLPEPQSLAEALDLQGIELPADQIAGLDAYRELLWDWNEKLNLTRHTTFTKFVARDLLDTLELSGQIPKGERVLDIGSGGGVPGIPLAIIRPDLTVALSESMGKKAKVLESIVGELQLPVTVYPSRAEQALEITTYDTLVARGVGSLKKLLTWFAPHWDAFDCLLLVKGRKWVDERGEARHHGLLKGLELRCVAKYSSPGFGDSLLLRIERRKHS